MLQSNRCYRDEGSTLNSRDYIVFELKDGKIVDVARYFDAAPSPGRALL